jgi:hypothetical protein
MNGRIILGVLLTLVVVAAAVGIGAYAYNVGVVQGMAANGTLRADAPPAGVVPAPRAAYGGHFFYHPFGMGFGFLSCIFPLLFFFLICALLRGLFWRGRWGMHHHGHWEKGYPPMFEEWHRKMHEPHAETK